jgi:carboxymethylenebutenolidase
MCFDTDSSPPIPVVAGAAISHDDVVLRAADGSEFAAFVATPDGDPRACVVILPDVRGLYRFYEELALRFAERGYAAVAIDYFGRTAGIGKRDDDFEYPPHVEQTTPEGIAADVRAAVEHMRGRGCRSIFTVGFYGRPGEGRDGAPGPIQRASEISAPILALQAGADQNITAEDNAALDRALDASGVEHEVVTYPGAPHSFFDRKQEEFQDASDDAWRRTLEFIERHA